MIIFSFEGNYCEHGKSLRKEVNNLAKQIPILSQRNEENFVTDEYSKVISQALLNLSASNEQKTVFENVLRKLNDLKEIEFHRSIADRQKRAYNNMLKDVELLENNIIIEVFC